MQEKEYIMAPDSKDMLQKAEGTKIQWKQGKDPTVKVRALLTACRQMRWCLSS